MLQSPNQGSTGFCQRFVNHYSCELAKAFRAMVDRVTADLAEDARVSGGKPLAVSVKQEQLHPHTCKVLLEGVPRWNESVGGSELLRQRMVKSRVDHVKWVAAVLLNDPAAGLAFLNLINGKVTRQIMKEFRGCPHARTALENLPSHLFKIGKTGQSRIAGFLGMASLDTWLVGIAKNQTINEQKKEENEQKAKENLTKQLGGEEVKKPDWQTAPEEYAAWIMKRLALAVIAASSKFSDRKKLVFRLVYVLGRKQCQAANYLGLTAERISQILSDIREEIARCAESVIRDIAEAANKDETVVVELLSRFLDYLKLAESDQNLTPLDWSEEALNSYIRKLFGMDKEPQEDVPSDQDQDQDQEPEPDADEDQRDDPSAENRGNDEGNPQK